jgi:hypothetical protein
LIEQLNRIILSIQDSESNGRFGASSFFALFGFGITPGMNRPFIAPVIGDQKAMSPSKGRGRTVIFVL